ncbi:MAG: SGNH/GDSL hydrolase family protein, partial [Verrucomicrobiota bacterium]
MILTRMFVLLAMAVGLSAFGQPFELKDGDRVAFLGDTLMEREQTYGRIETALTLRFADRHVTFRNLGWSGDTPRGISRQSLSLLQAGREPDDEGFKLLKGQLELVKPTVVFLGYGMANSFEGEAGLSTFIKDLQTLIDTIQEIVGKDQVRFVVVSPIKHEKLPAPLPDPAKHNEQLSLYTKALRELAQERGFPFVSLYEQLVGGTAKQPLTDNGIHLNDFGYQRATAVIEKSLGWSPLKLGRAQQEQAGTLREVILKKNEWFFHRSRPANMAYIFGFRKREQGQNAVE